MRGGRGFAVILAPEAMLSRFARICLAAWLSAAAGCGPPPQSEERPPNFVIILADDLGYGDLGCYGNARNRTPNIDRLAAEGLRFTDFHANGPMCTPTRAALLTGRYQHRFGPEFEAALSGRTHYDFGLPVDAVTIADALGKAGYAAGMYGKWHLGYHPPFMPGNQGFDDFRGLTSGGGDHHSHIDRSGRKDWWRNGEIAMEQGYSVDLISRHSIAFIEKHAGRPFFLYVPHQAIHFPWQGPNENGYRVEGGDYHDLSKLGIHESKDVSAKVKEMIEAVDDSVGAIVRALRERGLAENTLVIFTSDNGGYLTYQGGYHNISSNGPLRGQKTDVYEGGHRVPAIAWQPGRIAPGVTGETAATFDLFPTLLELAGASPDGLSFDGASLAALLFAGAPLAERSLFWKMREERAMRRDDWKLVQLGAAAPELYDLQADIGEQNDLAAEEPQRVSSMSAEMTAWEETVAKR